MSKRNAMPFVAMPQQPRIRTDWSLIDHIRIVAGRRPDTPLALRRWSILVAAADADGTIATGEGARINRARSEPW